MKAKLAILILALIIIGCKREVQPAQPPVTIPQIEIVTPGPLPDKPEYEPPPTDPTIAADANVVEIKMDAKRFDFYPNQLNLKKGQRVRLIITAQDVPHTFTLPAYKIDEELPVGEDVTIEFIADKTGAFNFYCAVKGHEAMKGKLVVS